MNNIEGDADAIEEVEVEYVAYDKNMNALLESENVEDYLNKYDEICKEDKAVLVCFNAENVDDLKTYIEEKEISFDDLKTQTVFASCEALKFLIYEAEEDDY